ncbi:MAG TPA: S-layer homology domain-containing protein [Thermoanaerobaculia bacterium]
MRTLMTIGLSAAFAAALIAVPTAAQTPESYGTSSLTALTISSAGFVGRPSNATWSFATSGLDCYITFGILTASPTLPNGAQIEKVELRACDNDPTNVVQFRLWACPLQMDSCDLVGFVQTNAAGTPGCSTFLNNTALYVVDNQVPLYADVRTPGGTSMTTFSAVRIYYRLRVSPSPAVATFPNDVPTGHPFFQFVEALAAAGITAGCAPGSFCPAQPVTRGEMAVFLAAALGLHFPN